MPGKQRLEKLKQKNEHLKEQIKLLESKERTREKRLDTRRKILVGAFYMEKMEKDEVARKKILARLDGFLTRPLDRKLFGLPETSKHNESDSP